MACLFRHLFYMALFPRTICFTHYSLHTTYNTHYWPYTLLFTLPCCVCSYFMHTFFTALILFVIMVFLSSDTVKPMETLIYYRVHNKATLYMLVIIISTIVFTVLVDKA